MPGERSRGWCVTLNNYTEDEERRFIAVCDVGRDGVHLRYAVVGAEVGENGTPHLQIFLYFNTMKSLNQVKGIEGLARCHAERMRGTVDQAANYCKKDGNFTEFGEVPEQGKRNDLENVVKLIKEGCGLKRIADENPLEFIKFSRGIQALRFHCLKGRDFKSEIFWLYGPTGTGKSRYAYEQAKLANSYYVKDPCSHWWDGYDGQEVVIIDDVRKDFCTFAQLLRMLDRYEYAIQCKGGYSQLLAKKIYLTNPLPPRLFWDGRTEEDIGQLMRRIDHVYHFPYRIIGEDGVRFVVEDI